MWTRSFVACFAGLLLSLQGAAAIAASDPGRVRFDATIEAAKAAMMADPQDALKKTDLALTQANALSGTDREVARATALWLKIEANIGLNRLVEAETELEEALAIVKTHANNSKLHGDLMRSRGALAALSGKASAALRDYLAAHRIFKAAGVKRSQAIALQDIGQIYWEAGDYERMLAYYDEAQEIYNEDPGFALGSNNNRGEAYRIMGRGRDAERAYSAALANARAMESPLLETRILSNLALVQADLGKLDIASRNASLAEKIGSTPEARDWLPFVYGVQATIASKKGDDVKAARLLNALFAGQDFAKTDLVYKEFHQLASGVFSRMKQPELAFRHLQAFYRLDREARELTASAGSQLLAAQFDSANQKVKISQLKQGQLERDVKIARQKGTLATALLIAAFVLIVVISLAFFSIRRSRNKVRDANDVLTQVNTKLESALKAKTDFLAMTSHEIRTPLNGIMGMTQVILADDRTDPDTREKVKLVLGAGQTMQSLVDDLLDVAKMETGEINVVLEPCNIAEILSECTALWRAEAERKGLKLDFVKDGVPSILFTDGGRIRQVVFNLLANAIKFTPEGSVTLSVKGTAETLEIVVEDSGIGIEESQLELIFEPFHQVDNAMSRNFGGAGLGLAISKKIVEALGGTIGVSSVVGKGTKFSVNLAASRQQCGAENLELSMSGSAGDRIIVLDHDEVRLATLKALLSSHATECFGVKAEEDAKNWIMDGGADILVVEANSVGAEGSRLVALSQLIASAKIKKTAVILVLPQAGEVTLTAATALEPDIVLQKPMKASLLVKAINDVKANRSFQSVAA